LSQRRFLWLSVSTWLSAIGVVALLLIPIPWVLGNFIVLAAGSGETVSVRDHGIVTCPQILEWSEWKQGNGSVRHYPGYVSAGRVFEAARITQYRVGVDRKLFSQLTFYQAKYQFPDGSIETGPAEGPVGLVSVDTSRAAMASLLAAAIGLSFLVFSSRLLWCVKA